MKIRHIHSYTNSKKTGVSAQIVFDNGKTFSMFFEVEKACKGLIAKDASPFLIAMLPIAMLRKEAIQVDGQVSSSLKDHLPEIMEIVEGWQLGLSPVPLHVKASKKDQKISSGSGVFFSGGADSFYTYLKNKKAIDSLIFVHGFDIKIAKKTLYSLVEKNIAKIADSEDMRLIKIKTNLRDIYDLSIDWNLAHGFAVGAVALFLRNGFSSIYVSCGLGAKNKDHYSMTPELDRLYSSEHTQVIHYGCNANKLEKLRELAHFPIAMKTLRVCWLNRSNAYNCSTCEKCLRNMLGLYVWDALAKCETFANEIDTAKLRTVRIDKIELKFFTPILAALDKKGDVSDVRNALADVIRRNSSPNLPQKATRMFRNVVRTFDSRYNNNRVYWFMANRGVV